MTVAEARVLVRSRLEAGNLPCIFVDADFEVGTDADAVYDLSKFAAYAADLSPEKMDRLKDELFGRIIDDIEYRLKTFPAHLSYLKIYIRLREPSDDTFEFIKEIVTSLKEQYKVVFSYWTEIIN